MFEITCSLSSRLPDRLIGPVLAVSDCGHRLVAADALLVGNCAALRFLKRSPQAKTEAMTAVLAVVAVLAVINCDGLPFIPGGSEFNTERKIAETLGFRDQTATTFLRTQLYGYISAPAGAAILDPTEPIELASYVSSLVRRDVVKIPILQCHWMLEYLATLAREGVPLQDRPPGSRWIN